MTLSPEEVCSRSNNYLDFFHAERLHFLELCRKYISDKTDLERIESKAKAEGIDSLWRRSTSKRISDWKAIEDQEWNGWKIANQKHPLDDELNPRCDIRKHFVVDWRASSAMVHCSIRSLDNNFAVSSFPFKVGERLAVHFDHSFEPLLIIVAGLFLSARYALYGANIEGGCVLDKLVDDTVKELRYSKQTRGLKRIFES
jgi:hypothetical protein